MGLLEVIGLLFIIYWIIQLFLWTILDCDIDLFLTSLVGKPISESNIIRGCFKLKLKF